MKVIFIAEADGPPCAACGQTPEAEERLLLFPLGPGQDPEARARCAEERPYNAMAVLCHADCVDERLLPPAEKFLDEDLVGEEDVSETEIVIPAGTLVPSKEIERQIAEGIQKRIKQGNSNDVSDDKTAAEEFGVDQEPKTIGELPGTISELNKDRMQKKVKQEAEDRKRERDNEVEAAFQEYDDEPN